jgi:putative endonuclease
LRCGDGTLYCGYTTDLAARLQEHRAGRGARYTRGRGPLELVYAEDLPDRSSALRREAEIKRQSRACKLQLIADAR